MRNIPPLQVTPSISEKYFLGSYQFKKINHDQNVVFDMAEAKYVDENIRPFGSGPQLFFLNVLTGEIGVFKLPANLQKFLSPTHMIYIKYQDALL